MIASPFEMTYYNYNPYKAKLRNAWEKYYDELGLSYSKKLKKVHQRVNKGKMPKI